MSIQYLFEAGTFPELSYTELLSVLKSFNFGKECVTRYGDGIFLVKHSRLTEITIKNIFKRLGGSVRLASVLENIDNFAPYSQDERKITFGISILGEWRKEDSLFLKKLGNSIKRQLKENGISSRFVLPMRREYSLNAAQILRNGILEKGFELLIVRNKGQELYAQTLLVQDLQGFVSRDIKKPGVNVEMGMLPPKLARMMVNFTGLQTGTIWDPFCGSGTIPMEAAVLGFNFLASDIDIKAVEDTDRNTKWLYENGYITDTLYETFLFDATKPDEDIVRKLKNTDISAIVCEPYMGPPQKKAVSEFRGNELLTDVKRLYTKLFDLIDSKLEKRGIMVVMIIPSYKTDRGWMTVGIRELVGKRWIVKNREYSGSKELKWFRSNSIIERNIYILERS